MLNRRFLSKTLFAVLFAVFALQPNAVFAAKGIVKVHEADWTGNVAMTRLVKFVLEEELDYKVKTTFLPAGPSVLEAVAAGELDVAFEFWPTYTPSKDQFITKWGGDGSIEYLGETGFLGRTGWYVPRYVIEGDAARGIKAAAPDLKSYEQLNQYKDVFAQAETAPKGRLVACPIAAWQAGDAERLKAMGIDFEPVELGSETAQWAELTGAYERGAPILVYMWEPHWTHAKFDMVQIKLPEYDEANWEMSGWPDELPFNFSNPTLKDRHPEAYTFVKNMKFTAKQQAEMILDIDVNGMEVEPAVRKWMAAHEDLWRSWLP